MIHWRASALTYRDLEHKMGGALIVGLLVIFLYFESRKPMAAPIQAPTVQPLPTSNVTILPSVAPPQTDSVIPIQVLQEPNTTPVPAPVPVQAVSPGQTPPTSVTTDIAVLQRPTVTGVPSTGTTWRPINYIPLGGGYAGPIQERQLIL